MSNPIIAPARMIARAGGSIQFGATGGSGSGYVFSFASPGDNASGATLNAATGAYVAGPRTLRTDRVTVTDSASNVDVATIDICGDLYRRYQSTLVRTADWQGPRIKLLEADLGSEKDIQFERARQAALANNPAVCPADALDYIGQERQLPRAVGESDDDYRARLQSCWTRADGWSFAGSHGSLLFALARAGFPTGTSGVNVMQRIGLYSWLAGSPLAVQFGVHPPWNFDASPTTLWNQFGLVFGADFTPAIGSTFADGDPSAALLNAIVATWKPAKARYMGARVMLAGPWWDWPVGASWDDAGRDWGDGVSSGTTRFVSPP